MNQRPRFPLLAKVLTLLVLHLVILGLAFVGFVRWQLNLGLDSLLSGSAGERLAAFGDAALSGIVGLEPREWHDVIDPLAKERHVTAAVFDPAGEAAFPIPVPPNVIERARTAMPPRRPGPQGPPGMRPGRPPGPDFGEPPPPPMAQPAFLPKSKPVFLMRGGDGGYWAGVVLGLPPARGMPDRPVLLLVQADRLDGSGMFFDFKPWLWGGVAVLMLSLAFWTPFVWGASRYLRRLTATADEIAAGRFHVALPARGDEFGQLGRAIESMAARLDHLVSGQKRFLGDAAHELCAPLARIRTALGILDAKLSETEPALLSSIESDTAELASLVDEILAFSRAGNRKPAMQSVPLERLVREVVARESAGLKTEIIIPHGLEIVTDARLLGRAVGNLVRNAAIHAGAGASVRVEAEETDRDISVHVTDNGPGVPTAELTRIFEPFHRLDPARGRETGGTGLGLAIVRTAVEACGGEVSATLPTQGGLCVSIRLPKRRPS